MSRPADLTLLPDLTHGHPMQPRGARRPVYLDLVPPCNAACPAGEDVQGWLALAQAERYEEAWRHLVRDNPLPAVHGRVCYHPCEPSCNRSELDAPVSIHAVERFLGDRAIREGWRIAPGAPTGARVLVVGAGPSGLSAAHHLRQRGHDVEIRDAGRYAGGMMLSGIPAYRLPRAVLAGEIARVEAMGVRIVLDHEVQDVLEEKRAGGFDAVFLAIGAHIGKKTDIPARDAGRVLDAVSLLADVARGAPPQLGRRVAVYGGGNTAMDAARVVKRLGHDPLLIYRRDREHMPARAFEADEAIEEGVEVHWLRSLKGIDGTAFTVEIMELDAEGKPRPTGRTETLEADALVLALGQDVDAAFLRRVPGLAIARDGVVTVGADLMTGHDGIFAGGDMVPSERTVTVAVGHGRQAARHMDAYLRKENVVPREESRVVTFADLEIWYATEAAPREQRHLDHERRVTSFDEVVGALSERDARFEAKRCLSCGTCYECDGCLGACPSEAVVKLGEGKRYRFDYDRCTGCAVCFEQCPVHAIQMTASPADAPQVRGNAMDRRTIDGNEAAASVAYRLNEVCAIYPITPSSPMAELADQWSAEGRANVWGTVPSVIEMQSEAGAAGVVHGALQTGALTTTFTSSQGLLLMIPNMFKIAGELTPAVFHVAARAVATHALSIFGDHSDVMSVRSTGFALLASSSVQEAHDLAAVAQAATLRARVPFVHFFDGFRTSHEIQKIELLSDDDLRALVDEAGILAHRRHGLSPERPVIRGTAQNPDVFFQSREAGNPFYAALPDLVAQAMDAFAQRTGRRYHLFDYFGDAAAERVIVLMGSGVETTRETVSALRARGERVGVLQVHLFRPFDASRFRAALPASVKAIAVLDRTKEPGAPGEPLYVDAVVAFAEAAARPDGREAPRVVGGRYGLGSKEFTPAMVKAVFDELAKALPKNHFTVGIEDDVSGTSLAIDAEFSTESERTVRAVFYGLGSDGTVGANKNSIKIIGEEDVFAQGYFVYDSKKSGSQTVSHLRFGPEPIRSAYLIQSASFIGCHQWSLLERVDVLDAAARGATLLLDAPYPAEEVWARLPRDVQLGIRAKDVALWAIDARDVAARAGLGERTNTIMQTAFFAISKVLPAERALAKIRASIQKSYGKKGEDVVRTNLAAIDLTLASLHRVAIPESDARGRVRLPLVPAEAPTFVRDVVARMMEGRGDELPVGALPPDGTYPSGTARWEKRNVSQLVPVWEPDVCIQCGNCALVCPHTVIRAKFYPEDRLAAAPSSWKSAPIDARGFPEVRYTLQSYVEDCTGCGLCVEACPALGPDDSGKRAINLAPKAPLLEAERANIAFFEALPWNDRSRVDFSTVRGAQFLEPLFEFPGACAGCGETPYLRLVSQLFGDRMVVANATGCSSIYGGNLPTTPWTKNGDGHGPAWANSLFEDNAEFGLGFRLAADTHLGVARALATELRDVLGAELVDAILAAPQRLESELRAQRARVLELERRVTALGERGAALLSVLGHFVRRSVWIVGGDGWAYDIGSGGLDHVLASGRDVNVLVLDTEVYSNTGGQSSKATPPAAVAKFAASGKATGKKDLALQAMSYGDVYVARVAFGANPQQTLLALREAEAYPGPSLVIAYSHCIAHGIDMRHALGQQTLAVSSGYWPLVRYNPAARASGENPFSLDSGAPRSRFRDYAYAELRYRSLVDANPAHAEELMMRAEEAVQQRWSTYAEMAEHGPGTFALASS